MLASSARLPAAHFLLGWLVTSVPVGLALGWLCGVNNLSRDEGELPVSEPAVIASRSVRQTPDSVPLRVEPEHDDAPCRIKLFLQVIVEVPRSGMWRAQPCPETRPTIQTPNGARACLRHLPAPRE